MLKTISHIIISVFILFVTIGISVSKHYSNGKLYSQSIFVNAETCNSDIDEVCSMTAMSKGCDMHRKGETKSKTSCSCKDTSEYLHFDADYTISQKIKIGKISEEPSKIFLVTSFIKNVNCWFVNSLVNKRYFKVLLPHGQIISLFQVFRC